MTQVAAGRSVLVVEDERLVALDLQQMLREFGYDAPAVASSADEALAQAETACPSLVLMDVRIKGRRDGIETAELMKRRFDVPVVYLTAHADDATLQRAARTAPHGYLLKPVQPAELRSAVEVSILRHEFERQQRQRDRWTAAILESIADAVVAVGLDRRVVFVNAAAAALTGIEAERAAGLDAAEVVTLDGGDVPVTDALREHRVVQLADRRLTNHATGREHIVAGTAAPVVDGASGLALGAVMVLRDVTERRRLDARLELAERLASIGTVAAGVAHEVNNPLTVVAMNVEFVREELDRWLADLPPAPLSPQTAANVTRALEDVAAAASRVGQIVADLKVFSQPAPSQSRSVDVERAIEWAVRATAHEFRGRAKLELRLERVPPVAGSDVRIGQVLVNLLVNAAQSMPPGFADTHTVTVSASVAPGDRVAIGVADTGRGIPADVLPHIFDPFFTTRHDRGGTGLGLAICHSIVSSLGGDIRVESQEGRGTTFQLLLPIASVAPEGNARKPPAGSAARVLVVDDEPLLLEMMRRLLHGSDVEVHTDARAALARIDEGQRYDVIITDVMLPGMSGVALLEALRERHPQMADRLVFTSGAIEDPALHTVLSEFPNRRLAKPFSGATLRALVREMLERAR